MRAETQQRLAGLRGAILGAAAFVWAAAAVTPCGAQTQSSAQEAAAPQSFTLASAISYALEHYPAVRAALERQAAAAAQIGVARTNYLPRADALWQGDRATHNDFFGMLIPQSVVPSVSGPILPSTNSNAWVSAVGLLVSWQPVDFGYRAAVVDAARAGENAARANTQLTRLDVATAVMSAYFRVISAEEMRKAAAADVERRETLVKRVHVLVDNQLRPGADGSRSDAELAAARIRLIQSQTEEKVARIALASLLEVDAARLSVSGGELSELPPSDDETAGPSSSHPAAVAEDSQIRAASAHFHALDRSYFPKFYLQSSISGRGTGVNADGTLAGGASGLNLQRENWAVGAQVTFSFMDFFGIRAQKQVAAAEVRAEQARYQETLQILDAKTQEARAAAAGARSVADATPIELQAAREAETQARARYDSGLASIEEVADAQSLLVQAETSDAIAKLNAWNGLAAVAEAQGDLGPFLKLLHGESGH